jgi:hypothetical protein
MKCPLCQFENPEGSNFCLECGGKITEHWAVADMLGLMQQLDVVPLPGQQEK